MAQLFGMSNDVKTATCDLLVKLPTKLIVEMSLGLAFTHYFCPSNLGSKFYSEYGKNKIHVEQRSNNVSRKNCLFSPSLWFFHLNKSHILARLFGSGLRGS